MPRSRTAITEGPILRALVQLALPIVLANVLQTVYQLVDTFWVGRLGAEAVAAVSLSFPVIFLLISIGGGVSIAGTILVAQYEGQGRTDEVNYVAAQTMLLVVVVSVLLGACGVAIAEPVMRLMGAAPAVLPDATQYLVIAFAGLPFVFLYFAFQSLMRGVGDVRTPMYIVLGTVLLNVALDPFFIFGYSVFPEMGVAGAALATLLSQGLASLAGLALLFSGRQDVSLRGQRFVPDLALMRRIVQLGFPASVENSTRALGLSFMVVLVAGFGSTVVAAYGIGTRILSFIIIPALGLSMATSTMVGQNVGAGNLERADRIARLSAAIGFGVLSAAGVLLFAFARPVTTAFIPNDPQVIEMGTAFLRIMALSFGFVGVQQVLNGAFRGSGNTFMSMVLAIVSLWVLRFPLAYVLAERTSLGPEGIWWAFPVSNVLAAVVAVAWFARGTWKGARVTEEDRLYEQVVEEALIEEGLE